MINEGGQLLRVKGGVSIDKSFVTYQDTITLKNRKR